jgi:GntR family transcriptional regulator, carbon starvation induced regulator
VHAVESKAGAEKIQRRVPPEINDARSISEFALRRLRSDILSARLRPGSKLRLGLLTSIYQIGVSPLRDALAQLAGDGLVILESQRGFHVAPVSSEDLRDVSEARKRIELAALELSIERGDEAWAMRVRAAYAAFCHVKQKVGDTNPITEDWEQRHRAFHLALVSACSSPTLLRFFVQLHDRFDRYRRIALPSRSHMGAVGDDHKEIMDAALSGKRDAALALLGRHIDDTATLVEEYFKPPEERPARHGRRTISHA